MKKNNDILVDIKNIIFDLGGVLLNIDPQLTIDAFVDLGFKDIENQYSMLKQNKLFDRFEKGEVTPAVFCNELRRLTNNAVPDEQIIEAWNALILDIPPAKISLLEKLKDRYRLFLLSNTTAPHIKKFDSCVYRETGKKLFDYFEQAYYSNEMGMRKPDREIFEYVMQQHAMIPSETLFIDDSKKNIEQAQKTGMRTILLAEPDMLEEVFR